MKKAQSHLHTVTISRGESTKASVTKSNGLKPLLWVESLTRAIRSVLHEVFAGEGSSEMVLITIRLECSLSEHAWEFDYSLVAAQIIRDGMQEPAMKKNKSKIVEAFCIGIAGMIIHRMYPGLIGPFDNIPDLRN